MKDFYPIFEEISEEIVKLIGLTEAWTSSSGMSDSGLERRNIKNKTVYMSPDEYIKRASRLVGHGYYKARKKHIKDLEYHKSLARPDVEDYKEKISNPEKEIDIPYLRYDREGHGQEGLHRAIAAKELGHKEIPVKLYYGAGKEDNVNRDLKKRKRAQIKDEEARSKEEQKKREEEVSKPKGVHKNSEKSPIEDIFWRKQDDYQ